MMSRHPELLKKLGLIAGDDDDDDKKKSKNRMDYG
jgi:ribosome assembly protein YihI (activator of Der GTPase)